MSEQTENHTRLMTRKQVPKYVEKVFGIRLSHLTLDTLASQGGGPRYLKFGRRAYYESADVDDWIRSRMTAKFSCTSEESVTRTTRKVRSHG